MQRQLGRELQMVVLDGKQELFRLRAFPLARMPEYQAKLRMLLPPNTGAPFPFPGLSSVQQAPLLGYPA